MHIGDLPQDIEFIGDIAIDTEATGLQIYTRDRVCVVQLSDGRGDAHVVHLDKDDLEDATVLKALLADEKRQFIFHFARFDIAAIKVHLGVEIKNIFCTKIASRLVRTYTDRHSLKELCREYLDLDLSKQQQCSDWANDALTEKQVNYAASDVLYLHEIRKHLTAKRVREGRLEMAQKCFDFLPTRVALDEAGWPEEDIFHH